jgi:hypothetical protein
VRQQHRRDTDVNAIFQQERYLRLRWVNDPLPDGTRDPRTAVRTVGPDESPLAVLDAYRQVRHRWVVLGKQGAGKTTLMLRLQDALLSRGGGGAGPDIPIVFPLATWNLVVPFHGWLSQQIADSYPALARSVQDADLANLVFDRVLPILDGFDEIPEANRQRAVDALNRLPPGQAFVLTSRVEEYRAHARGGRATLNRAVVSTISDLSVDDVAEYLAASTTSSAAQWRAAARGAGADDPVRELLTTPVAIWPIGELGNIGPAELRNMGDTSADIAAELFRELIAQRFAVRSTYRGSGGTSWHPESARAWLAVLAGHVSHRVEARSRPVSAPVSERDPQDIAWWELADEMRPALPWLSRLASGLVPGAALGLGLGLLLDSAIGPPWGFLTAAGVAAGFGVSIAVLGARSGPVPPTTVELGSLGARVGALAALLVAAVAVAASVVINGKVLSGLTVVGLLFGAVVGLPYALVNEMDIAHAQSPTIVYERDRRFVWVYVLVYGLPCTAFGLLAAQSAHRDRAWGVVFGLVAAAAGGLFNGIPWMVINALAGRRDAARAVGTVAWARFQIARLVWSRSEPRLPWRLLPFLDDCVATGLLRQIGPVYQFRHQIVWRALVGLRRAAEPAGSAPR